MNLSSLSDLNDNNSFKLDSHLVVSNPVLMYSPTLPIPSILSPNSI